MFEYLLSRQEILLLPIVSIAMIIGFALVACYYDIKNRRVEHEFWIPVVVVNTIAAAFFIITGLYPIWIYFISLVSVILYFTAMKLHFIEGADFVLCAIISVFFVYNPFTGHWLLALPFMIFLCAYTGVCAIFVVTYNIFVKQIGVSFEFERGFPLMIPITAALITTVILV